MRTENKNSYTYVYIVAMSQYSYNKGVCGYFLSISRVRSSNAGAAWGQQKKRCIAYYYAFLLPSVGERLRPAAQSRVDYAARACGYSRNAATAAATRQLSLIVAYYRTEYPKSRAIGVLLICSFLLCLHHSKSAKMAPFTLIFNLNYLLLFVTDCYWLKIGMDSHNSF